MDSRIAKVVFTLAAIVAASIGVIPVGARETSGTVWREAESTVDNNTTIEFHLKSAQGDLLRVSDMDTTNVAHDFVDLSGVMVTGVVWGNGVQEMSFWIHGSYGFRQGVYSIRAEVFGHGRKKLAETSLGAIAIDCWEHKGVEVRLPPVPAPVDLKQVELMIVHVKPEVSEPCVSEGSRKTILQQAGIDFVNGISGAANWLFNGDGDTQKTPALDAGTNTPPPYYYSLRYYCENIGDPHWAEAAITGKSKTSHYQARQAALAQYYRLKNDIGNHNEGCRRGGYTMGGLLPDWQQPDY